MKSGPELYIAYGRYSGVAVNRGSTGYIIFKLFLILYLPSTGQYNFSVGNLSVKMDGTVQAFVNIKIPDVSKHDSFSCTCI